MAPQNLGQNAEETKDGCYISHTKEDTHFYLQYTEFKPKVPPPQDSSSSGVGAVVHLNVVELTDVLNLQAEVPEAQCDHVTFLD